ncbi:hypothetical protein AMJ80_11510 [bacterium SM23_31]|nr:MAG: hypothetical protein AMJ80_11510 [bacterium SM23_31]
MFIKTITVSPFASNCYLVASANTRRGVVIDPGDDVEEIIRTAQNENVIIEKIINTHGHIDHTAGVKEMQERLKIPYYIHKADMMYLLTIPHQAEFYGMKTLGVPNVNGYLRGGDSIDFDKISLKVIHTPGHTPGGVCFLGENEIFTGDTLFAGSIGRTDLPGGSYDELIHSITTKLLILNEDIVVYSGHGPSTTIGIEKQTNPFLKSF